MSEIVRVFDSERSVEATTVEKTLDRISLLPDSILLHVLSFLPARNVIRTCTLSKRWRFLWTFVTDLDFDYLTINGRWKSLYFVSFVSNSLLLHQSPKLKKLCIHFYYREKISTNLDVWLLLATRKNVEELELDLVRDDDDDDDEYDEDEGEPLRGYVVPLNVLNNSFLVSLKLVLCVLGHGERINWRSLKFLSLSKIFLSNDLIGKILCGSPLLEFLELCDCRNFDFLDIKSERMRKLVLKLNKYVGDPFAQPSYELKIVAPHIKSLEISGCLNSAKLPVTNSSSLVDVLLDVCLLDEELDDQENAKNVQELFQNLQHVKYLTVGSSYLKVLPLLEMETLAFLPSKLECLRVCTNLTRKEQSGIVALLSLFGHGCVLLKLVISIKYTRYVPVEDEPVPNDDDVESYFTALRHNFTAALERIKTVKFVNFSMQEREIQFIQFLLKNARHLEKMIIDTHPDPRITFDLKKSFETAQRILSTPRCSENSVVLFS